MPDQRPDRLNLPPGPPRVEWKPGLADEMMRELAPLLAEEGVDVDDIDVPDLPTLQAAMNRAGERHNMTLFTPVGSARTLAVAALRDSVGSAGAGRPAGRSGNGRARLGPVGAVLGPRAPCRVDNPGRPPAPVDRG